MKKQFKILLVIVLLFGCQAVRADWVKQNTNSFAWYKDIFFLNETHGWIVGSDGVFISTTDGGSTWMKPKKFTSDTIIQAYFSDEMNGWLLCERNVYARGNNATSYLKRTTDGGFTWSSVEFEDGGRERVTKLFFNMDGVGTAFGEGGIFYKMGEDGVSWKKMQTAI
ncbi:MAG: YCF48-related protein, partial [Pyrinomonadaceae bacterium]